MELLNLTQFKKELLKKLGCVREEMRIEDFVRLHLDYYKSGLDFEKWCMEQSQEKLRFSTPKSKEVKLKCPFCGCDRFKRRCDDEVYMMDDGETVTDELVAEPWTMDYTYTCSGCGKDVTNMELNKCFGDRTNCSESDAEKCKLGQHCTDLANM